MEEEEKEADEEAEEKEEDEQDEEGEEGRSIGRATDKIIALTRGSGITCMNTFHFCDFAFALCSEGALSISEPIRR